MHVPIVHALTLLTPPAYNDDTQLVLQRQVCAVQSETGHVRGTEDLAAATYQEAVQSQSSCESSCCNMCMIRVQHA